jgi:hypothetical protein
MTTPLSQVPLHNRKLKFIYPFHGLNQMAAPAKLGIQSRSFVASCEPFAQSFGAAPTTAPQIIHER